MKRDQFTIRASKELLDRVREEAAAYGESMNDLVVAAVEKEVLKRQQLRLLDQMKKERVNMENRGVQADSTALIRQLRAGDQRAQ